MLIWIFRLKTVWTSDAYQSDSMKQRAVRPAAL